MNDADDMTNNELKGEEYWRSLDERNDTAEFREFLRHEFPAGAEIWEDGVSRRSFLKVMGASLSLAGLTACVKQPDEKILPYVKQPEYLVPGKPLSFASAFVMDGYATGILVTSHMGRPTKIEGNPDHPASLGSSDIFSQASILSLYDPDRSRSILRNGEISTWNKFIEELGRTVDIQKQIKGSGLRVLTGPMTSPTFRSQMTELKKRFPDSQWYICEGSESNPVDEGARIAFGRDLRTHYRFDQANVVLSIGSDFLESTPAHTRHIRDFAKRRKVRGKTAEMNRLYVAETMPSVTGSSADHRLRVTPAESVALTEALASLLGVGSVTGTLTAAQKEWIGIVARDLRANPGKSIVIAGDDQHPYVHARVHAINAALGNTGTTMYYTDSPEAAGGMHSENLNKLADELDQGDVDLLLIAGTNPVYSLPGDSRLRSSLSKAGKSVYLGPYVDETASVCSWHIPESHYLESWSDACAIDGTTTIMQPLIAPLYSSTRSLHELLAELNGNAGGKSHDIVKGYWRGTFQGTGFEQFWETSLHNGVVAGTALEEISPGETRDLKSMSAIVPADGLLLNFGPDPSVRDGAFANNGWLQELPKPVSKLTWENAAMFSPATAKQYDLSTMEIVSLSANGESIEIPVMIIPGHADGVVTLHTGYGRRFSGNVGNGIGVNVNPLRRTGSPWCESNAQISRTGKRARLGVTQDHHSMEGREIVRAADLDRFREEPDFAQRLSHNPGADESLYPPVEYNSYAWGMSIDLNACTGCNGCMIACQSENNIPIVGKEEVLNGREMHWIRVDQYYKGDEHDPEIYSQPVPCMHCENAPCEVVCPVAATTHDAEGLNVMTYNRCVGTRYCSNNCPYKVRRFNFLQYSDTHTESLQLMMNPDVTVRNRGVMEKCTYCVQRISSARITAKKEGREIQDGEVVTACQSACPAEAIVFGDINNPESRIAAAKGDPRDYSLLAELNTKPRTTYMAKLRNPNPEMMGKG